jgi:hypothetical protein
MMGATKLAEGMFSWEIVLRSTTCSNMLLSLILTAGLARAYTVTNVDFLMFKNIDPIVFPGQYVSHMHSFFGSDAVNVNTSTSAELREGCSTARNPNDFSVYCTSPSLLMPT